MSEERQTEGGPLTLQSWCKGQRKWEQESVCLDCMRFSYRAYQDPEWKLPAEYEKERWMQILRSAKM